MLDLLSDPAAWASLLTLTLLEVVLGIDNVIFLSIVTQRLPEAQRPRARQIGLLLALVMRILLLVGLVWLLGGSTAETADAPVAGEAGPGAPEPAAGGHGAAHSGPDLFSLFGFGFSLRDVILIAGGLFLLYKATQEIFNAVEGEEHHPKGGAKYATFGAVIVQIVLIDLVFSVDSVLTAVGLATELAIMVTAVVISIVIMMVAAKPISDFVNRHPTTKMLALAFLMVIGVTLIADGFGQHIERGYIYAAIAFSLVVEVLNLLAKRRRARLAATGAPTARPPV